MIVVLRSGATGEEIAEVERELERRGIRAQRIESQGRPLLHLTAGPTRRARKLLELEQVEGLVPTSGPRVRAHGRRFYPYHFVQLSAACLVLTGGLVLLAGHLPPGLGEPIDAQHPPAAVPVAWYARAPLAFVALFPPSLAWLGWLCLYGIALVVFLLPLLDRSDPAGDHGRGRSRGAIFVAAGAIVLGWLYLTLAGAVA